MNNLRTAIWESMLDIDMNCRYYGALARRCAKHDRWMKIFVAATSSTSIASWTIWNNSAGWISYQLLWQVFTALSALVAIAMPILDYPREIEKMASLKASYASLLSEYERLWRQRQSLDQAEADAQFEAIKKEENELVSIEASVKREGKLLRQCQNDVEKSRFGNKQEDNRHVQR